MGHPVQPPAKAGSPTAGCTAPRPGGSGISPEKENRCFSCFCCALVSTCLVCVTERSVAWLKELPPSIKKADLWDTQKVPLGFWSLEQHTVLRSWREGRSHLTLAGCPAQWTVPLIALMVGRTSRDCAELHIVLLEEKKTCSSVAAFRFTSLQPS